MWAGMGRTRRAGTGPAEGTAFAKPQHPESLQFLLDYGWSAEFRGKGLRVWTGIELECSLVEWKRVRFQVSQLCLLCVALGDLLNLSELFSLLEHIVVISSGEMFH